MVLVSRCTPGWLAAFKASDQVNRVHNWRVLKVAKLGSQNVLWRGLVQRREQEACAQHPWSTLLADACNDLNTSVVCPQPAISSRKIVVMER